MSSTYSKLPKETLTCCKALAEFLLQKGISGDVVDILKDEEIDGKTLLRLTGPDLRALNIKMGPTYKILEIIEDASTVECIVQPDGSVIPSAASVIPSAVSVESGSDCDHSSQSTKEKECCSGSTLPGPSGSNLSQQQSESTPSNLYDVRLWVQEKDKESASKGSLEAILDKGVVKDVDRQSLVRTVISHLKSECGNVYPSKEMKIQAAKSIIISFPKLKLQTGCGYEHFYDEKTNSGFLEWRLKTMRKGLKDSEKKRTRGQKRPLIEKNTKVGLLAEEYESKVSQLQFKMPNDTNKLSILELMDETRVDRQKWIKDPEKLVTLNDVIKKFPRFTDYKGELILREFQQVITDKDTFLGRFPSYYAPRILQYCKLNKPHLLEQVNDIADDNLKALIILPSILPSPNYTHRRKTNDPKKVKGQNKQKMQKSVSEFSAKKVPNDNLLRFVKTNDDIMQAVTSSSNKLPVQPFLICVTDGSDKKGEYFIKADNYKIAVGSNAIAAFDILVKMHFVFDLQYAPDLEYFYNFITSQVMSLDVPARSCCSAFNTTLLYLVDKTTEKMFGRLHNRLLIDVDMNVTTVPIMERCCHDNVYPTFIEPVSAQYQSSNQTDGEELPDVALSLLSQLLVGLLLLLLIFLSVAGNVLVIVAICTDRALRRIGNLFLASLAVADLFVGCLVMTFAGVNDLMGYWLFGSGFCDTWVAFDVMCSTASILNLCAISLDRYIHIKDPLRYGRWVTKKIAWASIMTVWLLAILISFLPISLGLHRPNESPVVHIVGEVSYPTCALDLTPTYAIVSSCISFYVPCIVMLGIYCKLYCYAQKHVRSIRAVTKLPEPSSLAKSFRSKSKRTKTPKPPTKAKPTSPYHVSDHKAAITVGVIMGVFLICWVPFFCVNIVAAFCKTCIPDLAFQILTWLGYSNSAFNPIIYSIFNTEFREAFKRILTKGARARYNQPSTSECGEFRSVVVARRNGSVVECNISPRSSADSCQVGTIGQRHRDTIVSAI